MYTSRDSVSVTTSSPLATSDREIPAQTIAPITDTPVSDNTGNHATMTKVCTLNHHNLQSCQMLRQRSPAVLYCVTVKKKLWYSGSTAVVHKSMQNARDEVRILARATSEDEIIDVLINRDGT